MLQQLQQQPLYYRQEEHWLKESTAAQWILPSSMVCQICKLERVVCLDTKTISSV